VLVQLLVFTVRPGDTTSLLIIAALAGVGVSAAYTLPDSLFADVIEWDELRTGRRQEGIFYGIRTLQFTQSETVLQMIRLLVSPFGALILCGTIILAWLFPLTREKYARIQKLLEQKRTRLAE
jgi:GPH family glycoside/pentoside/hexuronide:cation symporter